MANIKNFIKNLIPEYFHKYDTYKDVNQEGLLIRFISLLGDDIDLNLIPKIEEYLQIRDIDITDGKFINYLSDFYGNPPDILTDSEYRTLLKYITTLYKIKGTRKAFEVYFSLLGLNVKIIEYWDDPALYDDFDFDSGDRYDQECPICSEYSILFWYKDTDCTNPTSVNIDQSTLDKLNKVIYLNEPINAKLRELTHTLPICDDFTPCIEQEVSWEILKANTYDTIDFDDNIRYDSYTVIGSGSITESTCG